VRAVATAVIRYRYGFRNSSGSLAMFAAIRRSGVSQVPVVL
jgi:hypothetical protein